MITIPAPRRARETDSVWDYAAGRKADAARNVRVNLTVRLAVLVPCTSVKIQRPVKKSTNRKLQRLVLLVLVWVLSLI